MRTLISTRALSALLVALAPGLAAAADGWMTDFEAAKAEAQRTGKPLLVHFSAVWCGPCKQMESGVLGQPETVAALKRGIVAVKVDADRRPDLSARFGIEALPSDIILEPTGERMMESSGYRNLNEYVAMLQRARTRNIELAKAREKAPATVAEDAAPTQRTSQAKAALMMDGYCPVTLWNNRKWIKGSSEHTAEFRGQLYHLASEEAVKAFNEDPRRYTPRFLGCDPVVVWESDKAVHGLTKFGAFYDDELYLFTTADNRDRFKSTPDRYTRTRIVLRPELIDTTVVR